jgi:hypothetical protein
MFYKRSLALLPLLLCLSGCSILGAVASKIPKTIDAEYSGLRGQQVAVMVWVDRGVRIDFPGLQLDTASQIQANLIANKDRSELKESTLPWEARSIVRFQREHAELEGRPATEYASRIMGVSRLIYVEVDDFSTRADESVQLRRGRMSGRVVVVEIEGVKSKVVYEKQKIEVAFPPKRPEGVIDVTEGRIYEETVNSFASTVSQLFHSYQVERVP